MRFKATGRYLCMNHSGKIYTQIPGHSLVGVENCIFRHEFLSNQYDVYYSWRYPNASQPCRRHHTPDGTCQTRWYLGVDRKGRVCTVKSSKTNVRRNSFFIQRWIHDRGQGQGRPEYPNPLLTSPVAADRDGTLLKMPPSITTTTPPPPRVASVFGVLSQRRRDERTRLAEDEDGTGFAGGQGRRGCLNLLKKCERLGKSRKFS